MTQSLLEPVRLTEDALAVRIIDQRFLPGAVVPQDLRSTDDVIEAIQSLAVRGAPAIGICAAAGLAVAMQPQRSARREAFLAGLTTHAARLAAARPTAVNLAWAVRRCVACAEATPGDGPALIDALIGEARAIRDEDLAMSEAIGRHGLSILPPDGRILTHCNAGGLATAGLGTALAPVYAAHRDGHRMSVVATETRPLLQGARLTAWELDRAGVPVSVIADSAAAALLAQGTIDAVLVGADRIAANGDVANKIGTYALALAAHHHGVPFLVLAPWSTVDPHTATAAGIPIEMRARDELAAFGGAQILPDGVPVWAPAFDVTPARFITAIITDRGVHRPPFDFSPQ